jgi:hypothetical protein
MSCLCLLFSSPVVLFARLFQKELHVLRQRYLVLLTNAICSTSPSPHKTATVVGSVIPQAAATATVGCQAATTRSRAAATESRAAAAGSRAVATRSPPRRRRPSLFEFLVPPPSLYYECQGDGTPYRLGDALKTMCLIDSCILIPFCF